MKKSVLLTSDSHSPGLEGPRGDRAKLLSFIGDTAAQIWDVAIDDICSPGRKGGQAVADAGRAIMAVADRLGFEYRNITRYLHKERSAFYHAMRNFRELMETERDFQRKVNSLWQAVQIREELDYDLLETTSAD